MTQTFSEVPSTAFLDSSQFRYYNVRLPAQRQTSQKTQTLTQLLRDFREVSLIYLFVSSYWKLDTYMI